MKAVPTTRIAKAAGKDRRTVLNWFDGRLVYFKGRGPGGRAAAAPLDLMLPDELRKYRRYAIDIEPLSQTSCKNISNQLQKKSGKQRKGGDKGGDNNFLYLNAEKSIVYDGNNYYVDKSKVATLFDYKKERYIRTKAARDAWDFIEITANGGMKKYYAVASLPADVQIAFQISLQKNSSISAGDDRIQGVYGQAPQKYRRIAERRAEALQQWIKYRSSHDKKTQADADFAAMWNAGHTLKVAAKTLHAWNRQFRQHGIDGLVPRYSHDAKRVAEWSDEAKRLLEDLFLSDERRSVFECYMIVLKQAQVNGWIMPSYATVRRHLDSLPRDLVTRLRNGHKAFVDQAFPSILRDRDQLAPGQIYVCDARIADISYGDGRSGQRVAVFVWVDFSTTRVMGVVFSAFANDVHGVLDSFYSACMEHVPEGAYLDNGVDMIQAGRTTKKTQDVPENLRAPLIKLLGEDNVRFARIHNPQTKIIERKPFADMARLCDKSFPGYTAAHVLDRGDSWAIQQKKGQFLDLDAVKKLIMYWFFEKYNNWAPGGKSPNEKWAEYFADRPKRRIDPERLRHLLLAVANHKGQYKYKVNRNGIEHTPAGRKKSIWYWAEWLQTLPPKTEVYVKSHPAEPHHIWVYDLDGKPLGEVPALEWQGVHPIQGGEAVTKYYKTRGRREKEILEYKKKLREAHGLDMSVADKMDRADIHEPPAEDIDFETGELIENTVEIDVDYDIPPDVEQLQKQVELLEQQKKTLQKKITRLAHTRTQRANRGDEDDYFEKIRKLAIGG